MKKIVCLLLALLMVLSVLASCGTEPNGDGEITTDAVVTEGDTTVADETTEKAEEATTAGATTDAATTGVAESDTETNAPTTTEGEATTEPVEEPLVMKDYDVSSFKIVYVGAHLEDVAKSFQSEIKELAGVELEIITGNGDDSGSNEFIIGRAEREISETCFAFTTFKHTDSVGVYCEDGKVQFIGLDRITIKESIEYFFDNVMTEESDKVSLPESGALREKVDLKSVDLPAKEDASYIRVVSNNILMHSITDSWNRPVTEDRLSLLIGMYNLIDADIMGFQECDELWRSRYHLDEEMLVLGYSKANTKGASNAPIYYKTSRFTEVAAGSSTYDTSSLGSGYEARSYGWACLEEIATGKQIVVINTHLVWGWGSVNGASEQAIAYRNLSARQLVDLTKQMKTTYPNAVSVVMGDLNSYLDSEVCSILAADLNSARDTAAKTYNMKYNSDMDLPGQKPARGNPPKVIDHIYYSKDSSISAKYYEVTVSKYSYAFSDHVPVLVDFAFN